MFLSSRRRWLPRNQSHVGHLNMNPHTLLSHYTGLSLSNNIMSITFSGPSQTEAVSGDSAVAKGFLAVQAREAQRTDRRACPRSSVADLLHQ